MKETNLTPQYITDTDGKRTAVIISLEQFEELQEFLEDLDDIAEIARRGKKPAIPHSVVLEELRRDGLLPD